MPKKKIAFITPIYLPANLYGSDTYVRVLAEQFARDRYDTSVITSNALTPLYWYEPFFSAKITRPFERINGVSVYRLTCNQLFSSSNYIVQRFGSSLLPAEYIDNIRINYQGPHLNDLHKLLERERFDVIHVSPFPLYINQQAVDAIPKLTKKPKLILTPFFHARVSIYENRNLSKVLDAADIVHVITRSEKKDIERMHRTPSAKIHIIPLFLDTRDMHEKEQLSREVELFKKKYHLQNKKIVLFAGLKGSMKGAVNVLRTIDRLYRKDSDFILISIGHNTSEWEQAKKTVDPDCLIDLGYKKGKEKEILFSVCDIYCMPSRSDSFGLVYLEAWHKKKPVIAADIPAARDLIQKNSGGLLVRYNDIDALESIITRLSKDSTLARKLGINGYQALKKNYTLDTVYPEYKQSFTD